jgi:hypothetical protein
MNRASATSQHKSHTRGFTDAIVPGHHTACQVLYDQWARQSDLGLVHRSFLATMPSLAPGLPRIFSGNRRLQWKLTVSGVILPTRPTQECRTPSQGHSDLSISHTLLKSLTRAPECLMDRSRRHKRTMARASQSLVSLITRYKEGGFGTVTTPTMGCSQKRAKK